MMSEFPGGGRTRRQRRHAWFVLTAAVAGTGAWSSAVAQDQHPTIAQAATRPFNIGAQSLDAALIEFSRQSGQQVSAESAAVAGKRTAGVSGQMSPDQALTTLLSGTGLVYRRAGAMLVVEGPQSSGATVTLDPVQVQGSAPPPQAEIGNLPRPYAGGQIARGQRVGLLGNRDFMDTPFTTISYTQKLMEDQQAITLTDVVANNPSIRPAYSQSAQDDRMYLRGFLTSPQDFLFNGLAGVGPRLSVDTAGLERVDVFLGPSALLNSATPLGAIGGTINLVPKRATDDPITRATARYVSKGQFGGEVDFGRRFGPNKEIGLRLDAAFLGGATEMQNQTDSLLNLTAGFDFRSDTTRIDADLGYFTRRIDGLASGTTVAATQFVPPPPSNRTNFYQPWEYSFNDDLYGMLRFEHDVTPWLTGFAKVGGRRSNSRVLFAFPQITNAVSGDTTSFFQGYQATYNEALSAEIGGRARFKTGIVGHEVTVVGDYLRLEDGATTTPFGAVSSNIYNPVVAAYPNLANAQMQPVRTSETVFSSIGFVDSLSTAEDRVQLIVGARVQRVQVSNYSPVTGLTTADTPGYDQSAVSPSVSLVVKPVSYLAVYGNYIQALQRGPVAPAGTTNAGQALPPFTSTQFEAGIKLDLGNVGATLGAFSISQQSSFTDPTTNTLVPLGRQVNQGLEFNVFGEPLEGLRILGGLTLLNPKLTNTANGTNNGKWAPGVPGMQLNFNTDYTLPFYKPVALTGRVIYSGQSYLNAANTQAVAAWTCFDLGARYMFERPDGKPIALRANVLNVGDANYWMATSMFGLTQGTPRTFMLSLAADF
jgi:iron complex outermembrane receptor protein